MEFKDLGCEELVVRRCARTGLHAAIAIHSTDLGPAAGGCRRWRYVDAGHGITDVQRLAQGMTYKNALADIPFGGGKSVIFADRNKVPTPAQLDRFAEWINELNGRYVTAEDVGMGLDQMRYMAERTRFVSGAGLHGFGGDPSPTTAYGVFLGLKTAVQHHLQREHLYGISVAIQGLGAVGMSLCHWLARAGATLYVADLDAKRVARVVNKYDAHAVKAEEITQVKADVFAPCALGGVMDTGLAETCHFEVIAGAANNQLADDNVGDVLAERGIFYAPDFVINAGGVVSVAHEHLMANEYFGDDHNAEAWVSDRIKGIRSRLLEIARRARNEGVGTHRIAMQVALEKISARRAREGVLAA